MENGLLTDEHIKHLYCSQNLMFYPFHCIGSAPTSSQPPSVTPTPPGTNGTSSSLLSQPQGSRLGQWKLPSPDKDSSENLIKAPGAKTVISNLQNSNPLLDSTWATSSNHSTWPTSLSSSTYTSSILVSTSQTECRDYKPQHSTGVSNSVVPVSLSQSTAPINTTASHNITSTSTTNEKTSPSMSSDQDTDEDDKSLVGNINPNIIDDMIEEFVPGKLWQGTNIKNPEDYPDITPGDCVSVMNQASWDSLLSGVKSPSADTWAVDLKGNSKPTWSSGSGDASGWKAVPSNAKSTRTPPGFMNQNKPPNWNQIHRSVSCAPGEHRVPQKGE